MNAYICAYICMVLCHMHMPLSASYMPARSYLRLHMCIYTSGIAYCLFIFELFCILANAGVFRPYMCTYKYFDVCCSTGGAPNWRGDSILKIALFQNHLSHNFDVVGYSRYFWQLLCTLDIVHLWKNKNWSCRFSVFCLAEISVTRRMPPRKRRQ